MLPLEESLRVLRIFVSSPGDVGAEREVLDEVVKNINEIDGVERKVRLEILKWETHIIPKIGPAPQQVIDDQLPHYDVYLGVMASRFGSPAGEYGSGTEKEFREAFAQWGAVGAPWILFYFKELPETPRTRESAEQLARVHGFHEELRQKGILCTYTETRGSSDSFFEQVSRHLRLLIRSLGRVRPQRPPIVFTSTSPRRRELLEQLGLHEKTDFLMVPVAIRLETDQDDDRKLTLEEAKQKALQTAGEKIHHALHAMRTLTMHGLNPAEVLMVGADTIVFCGDHLLDRPLLKALEFAGPLDIERAIVTAREMLDRQRGKEIHVITGLVVACADDTQKRRSKCIVTIAKMKDFEDADIESYVRTREPFDKAGAFGIQGQGVALFEKVSGSYTNIVGLPILDFYELLRDPLFKDRVWLPTGGSTKRIYQPQEDVLPNLSVVSVGDINYDFVYDNLPEGFFGSLVPSGPKVQGEIYRAPGGTAVTFAAGAKKAGFRDCSVLGVVGGDALGETTEHELHKRGIATILPRDHTQKTSIAFILRERGRQDFSVTLTDARQQLPPFAAEKAKADIQRADVLYLSGYCLTDRNRSSTACEMVRMAKQAKRLVVLDAVSGMSAAIPFQELKAMLRDDTDGRTQIDVLAAEISEIFSWFDLAAPEGDLAELVAFLKASVLPRLHQEFTTVFLRTPSYSHELISSPSGLELSELPYSRLRMRDRLGYGDSLTARHIFEYLSPRILLASRSPQRRELLKQVAAANKIEVRGSHHGEEHKERETPVDRVVRLAIEKAEHVLAEDKFAPSIEMVIGADTEIALEIEGRLEIAGHPRSADEAKKILSQLSGGTHRAISGIAVIGTDPLTGRRKVVADCVHTRLRFRRLTESDIEGYAFSGEPIGRAGGFAIQERGGLLVEEIEGSYSNVVGLPLERLTDILSRDFARPIWDFDKISSWRFPKPIRGTKI
jgi:septum formation protein